MPETPPLADTPFPSTDDARVSSQPMRHQYRQLTEHEKGLITALKDNGLVFMVLLDQALEKAETEPEERAIAISRARLEEAVMWAVKAITT